MAVLMPSQGKIQALSNYLASLDGLRLKLFQNNYDPVAGSTPSNFTEANFSGYTAQSCAWGTVALDGSSRAASTATSMAFAHSGSGSPNTVYGYYVVTTTSNKVVFAEKFAAAKTMAVFGDSITITPTITLTQG